MVLGMILFWTSQHSSKQLICFGFQHKPGTVPKSQSGYKFLIWRIGKVNVTDMTLLCWFQCRRLVLRTFNLLVKLQFQCDLGMQIPTSVRWRGAKCHQSYYVPHLQDLSLCRKKQALKICFSPLEGTEITRQLDLKKCLACRRIEFANYILTGPTKIEMGVQED